jgi:hypothetical protein
VWASGENCHCSGSWRVAMKPGEPAAGRRAVGGSMGLDTGDWRRRARWAAQSPSPKTLFGGGQRVRGSASSGEHQAGAGGGQARQRQGEARGRVC